MRLHPKARHYCYAWKIDELYRHSDDGEPSGTAGKPIWGQIEKYKLNRVGIVVVRYFGGVLLGTGGLIQAYRGAAVAALDCADIVERQLRQRIRIDFDYQHFTKLMQILKSKKAIIELREFGEKPYVLISCPLNQTSELIRSISASIAELYPSELKQDQMIEGLDIKLLDIS